LFLPSKQEASEQHGGFFILPRRSFSFSKDLRRKKRREEKRREEKTVFRARLLSSEVAQRRRGL
jgi:hypothetical protein